MYIFGCWKYRRKIPHTGDTESLHRSEWYHHYHDFFCVILKAAFKEIGGGGGSKKLEGV